MCCSSNGFVEDRAALSGIGFSTGTAWTRVVCGARADGSVVISASRVDGAFAGLQARELSADQLDQSSDLFRRASSPLFEAQRSSSRSDAASESRRDRGDSGERGVALQHASTLVAVSTASRTVPARTKATG